jgi:WD40 repeat protein
LGSAFLNQWTNLGGSLVLLAMGTFSRFIHQVDDIILYSSFQKVDCSVLIIKNIRDSYGGNIWALAANKRDPVLAIGCEDGTAKLFSYRNAELEYLKSTPSSGSRVISICFHPTKPQLYTGGADGVVRVYDEVQSYIFFH